jgi:hypothetical protein
MDKFPKAYSPEDIPIGPENAISRRALAKKWNTDDRTAREIIARLRESDNGDRYVIVSHSGGKGGYYRTNDPILIRNYYNETMNRARSTFKPLKKVRRVLKEIGA